jgi:hypothetical protein
MLRDRGRSRWPALALTLLLVAPALAAQGGRVEGRVRDQNGHPVAGAEVRVDSTTLSSVADSTGHYLLDGVPAGPAVLTGQSAGFNPIRVAGLQIAAGQTISQDLVLESLLPSNGQYLTAAYVVAGCIYLAYTGSLLARASRSTRQS